MRRRIVFLEADIVKDGKRDRITARSATSRHMVQQTNLPVGSILSFFSRHESSDPLFCIHNTRFCPQVLPKAYLQTTS